uniref:Uncharacterized protein n=1 Tax=Arundo donax TaxID=35708 RepID=A0A0A9AMB7_ARUDO
MMITQKTGILPICLFTFHAVSSNERERERGGVGIGLYATVIT